MRPSMLKQIAAVFAGVAVATSAPGEEVLVQNDSVVSGGTANVCICFVAGEEAAVWLTSPCDGTIVGVQLHWRAFMGTGATTTEDSISIRTAGTSPVPGPLYSNGLPPCDPAEIVAPELLEGGVNELRFLDAAEEVPIRVPISEGETFVVSLRFANDNAADFSAPSILSDSDGCQAGLNAVFAIPGGWSDACALGVSGDWAIRAIVECGRLESCTGDTNGDDVIDVNDLNNVFLDWGAGCPANGGDVTGQDTGTPPDGVVDVNDLNAVIVGWGACS